jgi:hypothetical protein
VRHGVDGADVVAVEVGHDEEVDPVDGEEVETRLQPLGVVTRVHQRDAVVVRRSPADQHGVTLTDVARRHRPRRRQSRAHHEPGHGDDRNPDRADDSGEQEEPEPRRRWHEDRDRDAGAHDSGGRRATAARGPRHRGEGHRGGTVGDGTDRTRGRPGHPREDTARPRPRPREHARGESDHRDNGCEGLREQVRRHRVRGDRRGERDRRRPAGELRCDRDGEGCGDGRPEAPGEDRGHRRAEDHDAGGREHREDERGRPCVPGVDDEHADHGDGDERDPAHRSSGEVDQQHDDGHHRRPHDRRVRPDEDDEREQQHHGGAGPDVSRESDSATEQDDQTDDHGTVRSGDRRQVGQRRGLHGRFRRRVEPAPVADREAAEERTAGLGQRCGDVDERTACAIGDGEEPGRWLHRHRTAEEDDVRRRASGFVGLQCGRCGEPGARGQPLDAVGAIRIDGVPVRRDHPDRYAQPPGLVHPVEGPEDGARSRWEVTGEDESDRSGAVSDRCECLRTATLVAHQHRDREQGAQRGRRQHERGGPGHAAGSRPHREPDREREPEPG